MAEIVVSGKVFRTGKLDVFEQAKVLKRSAKLLQGLLRAAASFVEGVEGAGKGDAEGQPPRQLSPEEQAAETERAAEGIAQLADALSDMSDTDMDYVLKMCLSRASVQRDDGTWAQVAPGGRLMFEDIDLASAVRISMETIQENLGPTLRALLGQSGGAQAGLNLSLQR